MSGDVRMRLEQARLCVLVLTFSAAVLYGTTYQQFRYFSLDDPGGAFDARFYVAMSKGNFDDTEYFRYRWLTPMGARLVRPAIDQVAQDEREAVKLSFYLINFGFIPNPIDQNP
jgi:hypothetical protein